MNLPKQLSKIGESHAAIPILILLFFGLLVLFFTLKAEPITAFSDCEIGCSSACDDDGACFNSCVASCSGSSSGSGCTAVDGNWGDCSATCGGGTQTCGAASCGGTQNCNSAGGTQNCNTQACSSSGGLGAVCGVDAYGNTRTCSSELYCTSNTWGTCRPSCGSSSYKNGDGCNGGVSSDYVGYLCVGANIMCDTGQGCYSNADCVSDKCLSATCVCTPDCSGKQCGQSNGCGGTCPSTDKYIGCKQVQICDSTGCGYSYGCGDTDACGNSCGSGLIKSGCTSTCGSVDVCGVSCGNPCPICSSSNPCTTPGYYCSSGTCTNTCTQDVQCPTNYYCSSGTCTPKCTSDASCTATGGYCDSSDGKCKPKCSLSNPCPQGNYCTGNSNGRCIPKTCSNTGTNSICDDDMPEANKCGEGATASCEQECQKPTNWPYGRLRFLPDPGYSYPLNQIGKCVECLSNADCQNVCGPDGITRNYYCNANNKCVQGSSPGVNVPYCDDGSDYVGGSVTSGLYSSLDNTPYQRSCCSSLTAPIMRSGAITQVEVAGAQNGACVRSEPSYTGPLYEWHQSTSLNTPLNDRYGGSLSYGSNSPERFCLDKRTYVTSFNLINGNGEVIKASSLTPTEANKLTMAYGKPYKFQLSVYDASGNLYRGAMIPFLSDNADCTTTLYNSIDDDPTGLEIPYECSCTSWRDAARNICTGMECTSTYSVTPQRGIWQDEVYLCAAAGDGFSGDGNAI